MTKIIHKNTCSLIRWINLLLTLGALSVDAATQPLTVGGFDDGPLDGMKMHSSNGIVVPMNVQGAGGAVGILANGSTNQIVYRFKRPSGYTCPLSVDIGALVYGEVPNLSDSFSYDEMAWTSLAQLHWVWTRINPRHQGLCSVPLPEVI